MFPLDVPKSLAPEGGAALKHPEYFSALDKARDELFHGRYRKALFLSFALPSDTPKVEVELLRAEALTQLGLTDEAIKLIDANAADPRAALLKARALVRTGRDADAVPLFRKAVEENPIDATAQLELGRSLERMGDVKSAVAVYEYFAKAPNDAVLRFQKEGALAFEFAPDLVAAAACVDRWATLTEAYRKRQDLHDQLLKMFVAAYDVVDRNYWPAHREAGRFLLARSKADEAMEELGAALKRNPNDLDSLELLGDVLVDKRSFDGLAKLTSTLRESDPTSPIADRFDSANFLLQRQFDRATSLAKRAVEKRPTDLAALAHLAAVQSVTNDLAGRDATLARLAKIGPTADALAHYQIGRYAAIFFDAGGAVEHLQLAVDRAPWWVQPMHALGDALLNEGEEDRARLVLDDAYALDPFNLETVNRLRVLDEIAKFKVHESAHFVFKFAEIDDPIVPMYIAPQMDSTYAELTSLFRFEPDRKPVVEVFPDAQSFSVRTAGVPGLETFGASQGRVMTVVAPRAGDTLGPFNWARVMRHEFVHTLNIMQTKGRVPRWLTEGLAVWQEHVPYRFAWVPQAMYERTTTGKLMTPAKMADALLRPRGNDGEVAYMTGFWFVEFLDQTFGRESILKLLNAYRDGLSEPDAIRSSTGVDAAALHQKFDAWARKKVEKWGYDEATQKRVEALIEEAKKLQDDNDLKGAITKWAEASTLQPMSALPHRRLAGLYLATDQPAEAAKHLREIIGVELRDNRIARRIAEIERDAGNISAAIESAHLAIQIDPYDPAAHDLLAGLAEKSGDAETARRERDVAKLLRERDAATEVQKTHRKD